MTFGVNSWHKYMRNRSYFVERRGSVCFMCAVPTRLVVWMRCVCCVEFFLWTSLFFVCETQKLHAEDVRVSDPRKRDYEECLDVLRKTPLLFMFSLKSR